MDAELTRAYGRREDADRVIGRPSPIPLQEGPTSNAAPALVQRDGAIEVPAVGHWSLHRASSVAVVVGRRAVRLPVTDGWLEVGDPASQSTLLIVAGHDGRRIRISARTITVETAPDGYSRWPLVGTADDDGMPSDVDLGLSYHGVHRNGDAAWARFTGTASTGPAHGRRRRRSGLVLTLDLLFAAPTATVISWPQQERRRAAPAA